MSALRYPTAVLASVALGLLLGAACFSDRTGPGPNPGLASCQIPVAVINSGDVVVAINNFAFLPDSILVPVGATVTWINCEPEGTEPHTSTADASEWDSPSLNPGARFSHTFTGPGEFPYHCEPHPFMTAKVVVQ
ncbi:MAG: cupredoxin domain-containing protein [Gemmatimonadales bacterium]